MKQLKNIAMSVIIIFLLSSAVQAEKNLSIPNVIASAGSEILVPVNINNASDILSGEFTIEYDPAVLTPLNIFKTDITENVILSSKFESSSINIAFASSVSLTGTGEIVNINFRVNNSAAIGQKSDLIFLKASFNENRIPVNTIDGKLTVVEAGNVEVSLPEVSARPNNNLTIYLNVNSEIDIYSMLSEITFNQDIVEITDVNTTALSQNASLEKSIETGKLNIALAASNPIERSGNLIEIKIHIKNSALPGNYTKLEFSKLQINEQNYMVSFQNGFVNVIGNYISGKITDAATGLPIFNATVFATNGYYDPNGSDKNGIYIIPNVPAGRGYQVTAYKGGYHSASINNVTVYDGIGTNNINISLSPGESTSLLILPLNPDPNPVVSEVMVGGTIYRYYRIVDAQTMEPVPGKSIEVKSTESGVRVPQNTQSDEEGIISIQIPSSYIASGLVDDYDQFSITKIGSISIPFEEQIRFECTITNLKYSYWWENDKFLDVGIPLANPFISVTGELGQGAKVGAIENNGAIYGPDSLKFIRQAHAGAGVEFGFKASAGVEAGPLQAKAGVNATIGGNISMLTEDGYQFPYANMSELEALAQYILFADGNSSSIDATLFRVLAWAEDFFTDQSSLYDAYRYDIKGIDVGVNAGAKANIKLGVTNNIGIQAGPSIGVGGHTIFKAKNYSNSVVEKSIGISGNYSLDISAGIVLPDKLDLGAGIETGKSGGIEFGIKKSTITDEYQSFYFSLFNKYDFFDGGISNKTDYYVDGTNTESTLSELDIGKYLLASFVENGATDAIIGRSSFSEFLPNVLQSLIDKQSQGISSSLVHYVRSQTQETKIPSFRIKVDLIFANVGGKIGFKECKSYITEKGVFRMGTYLPLQKYTTVPGDIGVTYKEIIENIIENTPAEFRALLWTINTFVPSLTNTKVAVTSSIATMDSFAVGDNGAYLLLKKGALPDTVSELKCASWGWYGESPASKLSKHTLKKQAIYKSIRKKAEDTFGMRFGIGGFYQFEPLNTQLLDSSFLVIPYSEEELNGINENQLAMYYEDKENHSWRYIGGTIDTVLNRVTAKIDGLHLFTLAPRMPSQSFGLVPDVQQIVADSSSIANVISTNIFNNDSTLVADGTIFTVTSDLVTIISPDCNNEIDGIQVASVGGKISFQIKSGTISGIANLRAESVVGASIGVGTINLIDSSPPHPPTDIVVTSGNGSLNITWEKSIDTDIAGYLIHYDSDASGPPYNGTATILGKPSPIDVGNVTEATITGLDNDTTYYIVIQAYDAAGNKSEFSSEITAIPTSITVSNTLKIPEKFILYQNYPNPFNPSTTISFALPTSSKVVVDIYNSLGQKVTRLLENQMPAGEHQVKFDAGDLPTGVYYYRIQAGKFSAVKKMLLIR